jgi:ABC-2 type transport system permease protein
MVVDMRILRIGWLLFITVLKRRLQYRGDLLLQGLDEIMRGLVALAMLQIYTSKTQAIGGYSADQLLFVLGFSLVPIGLFHCLCGNLYQLSSTYLINGALDRVLLRPYPSFLQVCFDRIAIEDLGGAIMGIAIMVVAAARLPGMDFDPGHLLLLGLMQMSAFGVVVAVFMAFAATGFWFEDRVGMVPPVYNLMEFGRWPNGIYHWSLKLLITLVIPFSFVAFYPASLFLGQHPTPWLPGLLTPLVAVASLAFANLLWQRGISRYHSSGS